LSPLACFVRGFLGGWPGDYVSIQRWNTVTHGVLLGMGLMRRLETRFPGLTTDWLWFGRTHGTNGETAEALGLTDADACLPMKIGRLAACSMHADP